MLHSRDYRNRSKSSSFRAWDNTDLPRRIGDAYRGRRHLSTLMVQCCLFLQALPPIPLIYLLTTLKLQIILLSRSCLSLILCSQNMILVLLPSHFFTQTLKKFFPVFIILEIFLFVLSLAGLRGISLLLSLSLLVLA